MYRMDAVIQRGNQYREQSESAQANYVEFSVNMSSPALRKCFMLWKLILISCCRTERITVITALTYPKKIYETFKCQCLLTERRVQHRGGIIAVYGTKYTKYYLYTVKCKLYTGRPVYSLHFTVYK